MLKCDDDRQNKQRQQMVMQNYKKNYASLIIQICKYHSKRVVVTY